jgi:hypothetical protein
MGKRATGDALYDDIRDLRNRVDNGFWTTVSACRQRDLGQLA